MKSELGELKKEMEVKKTVSEVKAHKKQSYTSKAEREIMQGIC